MTELELFEAVDRGSVTALHALCARIERCVRWQLGAAGESEVQDACDRVREKLEGLRRRGFSGSAAAFRSYLYRVVATQVIEVKRERALLLSLDAVIDGSAGAEDALRRTLVTTSGADTHAGVALETRRESELLRQALARLDQRCRRLLWEREVEQRAEREIAAGMGLTTTNVGVSLLRCRERLYRHLLSECCADLDPDWERAVSELGDKLGEPLRTVFQRWWNDAHTVRRIAADLGETDAAVKRMLARAKAGVWRLAQETGKA